MHFPPPDKERGMTVRDVMTANPAVCTRDMGLVEVGRLMVDCDCGEIPVVDSKNAMHPIGVVTDRDLVCRIVAEGRNPADHTAADCMTSPVVTVTPDTDLDGCVGLMEERQIRRVPVVDERGRLVGIVAQSDIARKGSRTLTSDLVREVSQPQPAAPRAS
jgi:CBS domain-containing protein